MIWLAELLAQPHGELLIAAVFFIATATLIAFCVPGTMIPLAVTSSALIGPVEAASAVVLGALLGSQILFVGCRRLANDRLRGKLGERAEAFEHGFAKNGFLYVIGLRLIGVPHFVVTAGCALTHITGSIFGLATLLGLLPAIVIAAAAGSAL
jgi:uncharacterized membrane protein YdjX (TVP38/TMEM64 family)